MPPSLQQFVGEKQWRREVAAAFAGLPAKWLTGSKTWDAPSLADGAVDSTTVTVTGAALGNFAMASFSADVAGLMLTASVTAADTITVFRWNKTGGAVDWASGTLSAAALVP